jgi:hypothetical protein
MAKIETKKTPLKGQIYVGKTGYSEYDSEFKKKIPFVEVIPIKESDRKHRFFIQAYPHADQLLEEAEKAKNMAMIDCEVIHTNFANFILRNIFKPNREIRGKITIEGGNEYSIVVEEQPKGNMMISRANLIIK